MFKARGLQAICHSCRLNVALIRARHARLQVGRQQQPQSASAGFASSRLLSTSTVRKQLEQEPKAESEEVSLTADERLSVEDKVRQARGQFGDALPRGYLNDEEYIVYKRYYGTPVFVDKAEDLLEEEVDIEDEIIEQRLPDGSTVLLRQGKDGQLEEIELEDEEEIEGIEQEEDAEDLESDNKSRTPEEWEAYREQKAQAYHQGIYEKSRRARAEEDEWEDVDEEDEEVDDFMRAHPMTIAGRSRPSPGTIFLPKETIVDPTTLLLTRANHKHLAESVNRIFGGPWLPFSASTPPARLGKEQKPIPLDPSQTTMSQIEADAYMAAVQPGVYASIMSAMVEVRRRLGSPWLEHLLKDKKGGTILDAGSGGMGVLVWHEILNAEWQRMHEESGNTSQDTTPLGKATVLVASDTLRHRASKLLENTTFIPRLPDTVSPDEEVNKQQPQKLYDLIIAPHTLWPLRQDYQRKELIEKYWSLLNPKGGVLVLIEKGLPRGFEVIAGARSHLLNKHISSPDSDTIEATVDSQVSKPDEDTRFTEKETGMIVAPCTNHSSCPMYQSTGISFGRKDFCYFNQRYIRPPYLQRILNATDRNHEDVQFSYLAVQRGRDQRLAEHDILGKGFAQSEETTIAAFDGHEWARESQNADPDLETEEPILRSPSDLNLLTLPRVILPPLKRRGHIILDVCTPSGTLERWTVPRSFSKQAFRDARKARWGDLWALGAKTRIPRNVRLGRPGEEFDLTGRKLKKPKKIVIDVSVGFKDGQPVEAGAPRIAGKKQRSSWGDKDGRYNRERKIRGSGGRKGRKRNFEVDERGFLDDM